MRKKRFDKRMLLLLVPAMAGSLATGIQDVGATDYSLAPGTYTEQIVLSDSDTLTVPNTATVDTTNTDAVYVGGNGVVINNKGLLRATANNNASIAAIYFANDLDGSLTNSGTISAVANADGYYTSNVYGILGQNITGSLVNSGLISAAINASATGTSAYATGSRAVGLAIYDLEAGGSLTNSGIISAALNVSANATADNAQAYAYGSSATGISMGDIKPYGTLLNSGTISATQNIAAVANGTANAQASASGYYAYGIDMGSIYGTLNNTGTISAAINLSAQATATNGAAYASASGESVYGIYMSTLGAGGVLNNSGTISAALNAAALANGTSEANAYAYGYYVAGVNMSEWWGEDAGTLDNSGKITAAINLSAQATATNGAASASASGYSVTGINMYSLGYGGKLLNSGTISATLNASANAKGTTEAQASAYGYDVYGIKMQYFYGTLTNTGTISAALNLSAIASAESAYAYAEGNWVAGIYEGSCFEGTLNNSKGTINSSLLASATATSLTGEANAYISSASDVYGVYIGHTHPGTALLNSGTINAGIKATATATGLTAANATVSSAEYAYGLFIGGYLYGTLDNSGTISASIDAEATATALGGVANALVSTAAYAYGLSMGTLSPGSTLNNSGTISASIIAKATATGSTEANATAYGWSAYGIALNDINNSTLDNSGTISAAIDVQASATATGGTAYAYASASEAYGIAMDALMPGGSLINSGTISASANATATAIGLTTATARAYASSVYGIAINTIDTNGTLLNSGTINAVATASASAKAANADARATASVFGVATRAIYGRLTNSGIINASATATATATGTTVNAVATAGARGIYADVIAPNGALENKGTINAVAMASAATTASARAAGIYVSTIGQNYYSSSSSPYYGENRVSPAVVNNGIVSATNTANLINSGTINATARGAGADAYAYGVYIDALRGGGVQNSGTISGVADRPEHGYSLYIGDSDGYGPSYGTVNNLAGGLLSGNLYVGGEVTVNNSGIIALPAMTINAGPSLIPEGFAPQVAVQNSGYALIRGDYNQTADGVLSFGAKSSDTYAQMGVGGTATFAPNTTLNVNLTYGNTLAVGTKLDNVIEASTLNATTFKVTDNSALLAFGYTIDGNTVDLTAMQQVPAEGIVMASGLSSGQGAAGALDRMLALYGTPNAIPGMNDVLIRLRAMETDKQVSDAIASTLPSLNMELPRRTLGATHNNIRLTRDRQNAVRGMSSGDPAIEGRNLWVDGFGSWADQKSNNGAFGYNADTYGVILGGDMALGNRARIGLALGFNKSDLKGDSITTQNGDVNSYQPMLYGSYSLQNQLDLSWYLGYGWHENQVNRLVPMSGAFARGDYHSWSTNAGVAASKDYQMDEKTTLTPSVRLDYGYIDNGSYLETGAGPLNLNVSGNNADELILGIDGKVKRTINKNWVTTANLGLGYDMLGGEERLNASYAGAPGISFSTHSTDSSNWLYRGGLDLIYGKADILQVTLRYDLEGRTDYTNQSLSFKLNKSF